MKVIGQAANKETIEAWHKIPNFMIIEGESGSGRKTMSTFIAKHFNADIVPIGNKVDDVREIIEDARQLTFPRIYLLDSNGMRVGAKNTLLKITEEPPHNCHIILLVHTVNDALPTLVSRCKLLTMLPYTKEEVEDYLVDVLGYKEKDALTYSKLTNSLGNLRTMHHQDLPLYYEKCTYFLDNIWNVSFGNSLNIVNWLRVKKADEEKEEKLDASLFVQCVLNMFHEDCLADYETFTANQLSQNSTFIKSTSTCSTKLQNPLQTKEVTIHEWLRELSSIE